MHGTVMTLEHHFSDTGSATEVTVDLEWRMSIEEIRVCTSLAPETGTAGRRQLIRNKFIRSVTIEKSRPKAYLPAH
jgi:hypothetical protein